MTKLVSALFLTAATIAAPALANPASHPLAFQRDGVHYVGNVIERADGTRLIEGHEVESGRAFQLMVHRGTVSGTYANQYVTYDVPHARATRDLTAAVAPATSTGM